jgi:hypothetical protein
MPARAKRYPAKSDVINFRIQRSTKTALQKAAAASGRTVSAETEHQLHRALSDMGTGRTHAIFAMIAMTIDGFLAPSPDNGKPAKPTRAKWWDDPRLFDQAAKLTAAALELLRPQGPASPESEDPIDEHSARFAIEATLREIQTADPAIPFAQQKPYQRWLALLKQDLGPLADRPSVFGLTADEARKVDALAKPLLAEYHPLSQKKSKTPADVQRLDELEGALAAIAVRKTIGGDES